jgi:hypothetical protein
MKNMIKNAIKFKAKLVNDLGPVIVTYGYRNPSKKCVFVGPRIQPNIILQ